MITEGLKTTQCVRNDLTLLKNQSYGIYCSSMVNKFDLVKAGQKKIGYLKGITERNEKMRWVRENLPLIRYTNTNHNDVKARASVHGLSKSEVHSPICSTSYASHYYFHLVCF